MPLWFWILISLIIPIIIWVIGSTLRRDKSTNNLNDKVEIKKYTLSQKTKEILMKDKNNEIIILDIETTGLDTKFCEITEIAAIRVDMKTMEIKEKFSSLINIEGNVPVFITNLTGITKQMLNKDGRKIDEVLGELSKFCGSNNIYAHYSPFDKRFIRHYLEKTNTKFTESDWVDTIRIFKNIYGGHPKYKLEYLIQYYGLADHESHRALDDVIHTLEVWKAMESRHNG